MAFGLHLTIDCYKCDKEKLSDLKLVYSFLDSLPKEISMTKIMPPYVVNYNWGKVKEDEGVSGFVMIAESHISIHTFPEKGYFSADVFSCKPFDAKKALKQFVDTFGAKVVETKSVQRGTRYGTEITRPIAESQGQERGK